MAILVCQDVSFIDVFFILLCFAGSLWLHSSCGILHTPGEIAGGLEYRIADDCFRLPVAALFLLDIEGSVSGGIGLKQKSGSCLMSAAAKELIRC
jgi:hypothetical protein